MRLETTHRGTELCKTSEEGERQLETQIRITVQVGNKQILNSQKKRRDSLVLKIVTMVILKKETFKN